MSLNWKIAICAALVLELAGGVAFSLSAVNPRFVKGLAKRIATSSSTRPKSAFLREAYDLTFPDEALKQKGWCDDCCDGFALAGFALWLGPRLAFAVFLALTALLLSLGSGWWLILGPLVGTAWCGLILLIVHFRPRSESVAGKVATMLIWPLRPVFDRLALVLVLALSYVTSTTFRVWYRGLKGARARGIEWALASVGLLSIAVSLLVQIIAVLAS